MRRVLLLVVSILMVVSMAVSPALAHDRDGDCWDEDDFFWRHDCDEEVAVVYYPYPVFIGFWNFHWYWGWFWDYKSCGYDPGGPLTHEDCWD